MPTFSEALKIANHLKKYEAEIDSMVNTMGVMAKNHFTANFRKQGFEDETVTPWKKRERNSYRTRSGKVVDDTTRGILIGKGKGTLRRSIAFRNQGKWSVVINTGNLPYAKIHNEGGMGRAFGKYPFKMPKRQFIGYSGKLNRQIISSFSSKIKRIFA
jgi:phage gpG-like protein